MLRLIIILAIVSIHDGTTVKTEKIKGHNDLFQLTIAHMNDFHAAYVQAKKGGGTCSLDAKDENCCGGLARIMTAIKKIKSEQPNTIFLNAGDNYQGTIWHNLFKSKASVELLSKLPHDAMVIGNHDFEDGLSELNYFLERFNAPVVVANIDVSDEPAMKGLIKTSTIIERFGKKIGIIGVTINISKEKSIIGKIKFLDEVDSINSETAKLKEQNVDIIIVLSHIGLPNDKIIAASCPHVDIVVGGHTHSFLFTGKGSNYHQPEDTYPVIIKQKHTDRTVLVVQAGCRAQIVGNLTVWFDQKGEIVNWEGEPIILNSSIEQDPEMLEYMKPWAKTANQIGNEVVAYGHDGLMNSCWTGEDCGVGNFITDSFVEAFRNLTDNPKHWTYASIAWIKSGCIRSKLPAGNVTYADAIAVLPFENVINIIQMTGDELRQILQSDVKMRFWKNKWVPHVTNHFSGLKLVYDTTKPNNFQLISVSVRCQECEKPIYEPLVKEQVYRVATVDYLINIFGDKFKNPPIQKFNLKDIDCFTRYLKLVTPYSYENDQRRIIL